jgi:hypothetical protein
MGRRDASNSNVSAVPRAHRQAARPDAADGADDPRQCAEGSRVMEAALGLLAVAAYVLGVAVLACAAVYFIAREAETIDEDAARERSRMDLL